MLARLAENLFWCGRYLVRAEDTARMVDVTWHMLLESSPSMVARSWEDLLDVLQQTAAYHAWADGHGEVVAIRPDDVVRWLVSESSNPGSVACAAHAARENARSVRELVSTEFWEAVNDLHLGIRRRDLPHEGLAVHGDRHRPSPRMGQPDARLHHHQRQLLQRAAG